MMLKEERRLEVGRQPQNAASKQRKRIATRQNSAGRQRKLGCAGNLRPGVGTPPDVSMPVLLPYRTDDDLVRHP